MDTGEIYDNGCYAKREGTTAPDPETCAYGDPDGEAVILFGDSHAAQWFDAVEELAARNGWWLLPVTKMACPPGDERVFNARLGREYTECAEWHADAMRLIQRQEPHLVLVATRAAYYRIVEDATVLSVADSADRIGAALGRDLASFAESGAEVMLIRDTPVPGFNVPDCIEAEGAQACTYPLDASLPDDAAQLEAAESVDAPVVDVTDDVCGDRHECLAVIGGLITFRDDDHLAATFAGSIAQRLDEGIRATAG
jgi:hypothetical protein